MAPMKIVSQNFLQISCNLLSRHIFRNFKCLPGGGLGKPQGGIKEENYFSKQEHELIKNIKENPNKLLYCNSDRICDNIFDTDYNEGENVDAIRQSCSISKHKDCLEEAFFYNEQQDSIKILQTKLKKPN